MNIMEIENGEKPLFKVAKWFGLKIPILNSYPCIRFSRVRLTLTSKDGSQTTLKDLFGIATSAFSPLIFGNPFGLIALDI